MTAAAARFAEAHPQIAGVASTLGTMALAAGGLKLAWLAMSAVGTKAFGDLAGSAKAMQLPIDAATAAVGRLNTALLGLGAFSVGWEIGTKLKQEFESVRLAGIALAQGMETLAEAARYTWERFKAGFNSAELAKAHSDHAARLAEIEDAYGRLAERSTNAASAQQKASAATTAAATESAAAVQGMGAQAAAAGQAAAQAGTAGAAGLGALGTAAGAAAQGLNAAGTAAGGMAAATTAAALAAKDLGVDLGDFSTGVSQAFTDSLGKLDTFTKGLDNLKSRGVDTGAALAKALNNMIDGARNQAELEAVGKRILALGEAGKIAKPQVDALLDSARVKAEALKKTLEDATPGVQSLGEAMRKFGLQTREDLERTAKGFKESWEVISQSTQVSLRDKIKAFERYREAAIAANGGVESSEVALQRRILETQAGVQGLGDAFEKNMGRARKAVDDTTSAYERLLVATRAVQGGKGMAGVKDSRLADVREPGDDVSSVLGKASATQADMSYMFSLMDRVDKGDRFGADEVEGIKAALAAARNNSYMTAQSSIGSSRLGEYAAMEAKIQAALQKAQNAANAERAAARQTSGGSTNAYGGSNLGSNASKTVNVNLSVNGGRPVKLHGDKELVEMVLRELADAKQRAML